MLRQTYDPTQPYRYITYGRMSTRAQNSRSPDQQFATVEETRNRLVYPWVHVRGYRDDGISGQYLKKRPQFQAMLRDIELGLVTADLIAVDTAERFGRADEIAEIRRKLQTYHGILVVTADSNFADPTGPTGKALGLMENIRSTEEGRIKGHNVTRGKLDTARRGRWPGGPAPLGFRLKRVVDESTNPPSVYSTLEPIPDHIAAVNLAFHRAAATGHGPTRLTQWWNACPDIPAELKPMYESTMQYLLGNRTYAGILAWGVNCTGVVNDTRVVQPNPDGPLVILPDFCPPVVDPEVFDRVNQLREARSARARAIRAANEPAGGEPGKLITPQTRGLTLKYLLSGLVRCTSCRSSMRAGTSGRTSKAGRRYTYYACPRAVAGACDNTRHVREDRLREAVVGRVRARLFPPPDDPGRLPDWFPGLVAEVRRECDRYSAGEPDRAAGRGAERQSLTDRLAGWMQTLGDPKSPTTVRADIIAQYERAKGRLAELEARDEADRAADGQLARVLDPELVLDQLRRLGDILAGYNPTLGNLELGRHIDQIACFPDGRVELRGTWLGVFAGAVELLNRSTAAPATAPIPTAGTEPVTPRKRGPLRLPNLSTDASPQADVDTSFDPDRFAGLPESFFWTDPIRFESPGCWSEVHAADVAHLRAEGMTHAALAAHFEVTPPTIRKALKYAAAADPALGTLPRKAPRPRWPESHYRAVADLRRQGKSLKELCTHFGKSEPLIRTALRLAAAAETAKDGATGNDPVRLPTNE